LSHIVEIQTQIKDAVAARAACRRLALPEPVQGKHELYSGEVEGLALKLPGWRFPAVADLATGQIKFDNFNGHWGDQKHLDHFLQAYAVEKVKIEGRRKGHMVSETSLADGSIKLTVQVGVAA
jgi:hypothetical protein